MFVLRTVTTRGTDNAEGGERGVENGGGDGLTAYAYCRIGPHCTGNVNRVCGSGSGVGVTQSGLKLPYPRALPRCLRPTPNSIWRRMKEGPECCRRSERSLGPPSRAGDRPRTTAVDRRSFDSIRQGGPTRTSADVSVPRLAGFFLIT